MGEKPHLARGQELPKEVSSAIRPDRHLGNNLYPSQGSREPVLSPVDAVAAL